MRPLFKSDFPNIKSLVLQSVYPSISTLQSNHCILVEDYEEDVFKPMPGMPKQLENYFILWKVLRLWQSHQGISMSFARRGHWQFFTQVDVSGNVSQQLLLGWSTLPPELNPFPPIIGQCYPVWYFIVVSNSQKPHWLDPPWKLYESPYTWIEEMEWQLYTHMEEDRKVSRGIFWKMSPLYHSWKSPGQYSWSFLPPQDDKHSYVFPYCHLNTGPC